MAGEYGLIPEVGGGGGVGASAGVMVVWVTVIDIYIYLLGGWVVGRGISKLGLWGGSCEFVYFFLGQRSMG